MTLSERLALVMNQGGDVTAIEFGDATYSWSQVRDLASALAQAMDAADPGRGDVAFVLRNRPSGAAGAIAVLAAHRCLAMVSPIQPSLRLCEDVRTLKPSLLVADREDWNEALVEAARAAGAAGVEVFEADGALGLSVVPGLERTAPGHAPRTDDAGIVVPTSGTTGPPKRISLSWTRLSAHVPKEERPIVQRRGVIQSNPLVTIGGVDMLLICAARPLTLVLMERLDVRRWAELVKRHKLKRAGLPPAGMRMMLDADVPKALLADLEAWPTGSAPLDPDLAERFEDHYGVPVLYSYGATEYGGSVAGWSMDLRERFGRTKRGSPGRAVAGVKLRVIDPETGAELPTGRQGVLEVNLPSAPVAGVDGWIRSTDLAHIDEDGFLFIHGRADDIIIRGGFKVPLGEVEKALAAHPAVERAAAVDLPDARLGQVPAAAVVLKDGFAGKVAETELIAWARERLAAYKVPVRVKAVDALPMTGLLKVSKPGMRALFAD